MTTKAKAPAKTVAARFRGALLASEQFTLPTHAPYDESVSRLQQVLRDAPHLVIRPRIDPEDADSAAFEIQLYYTEEPQRRKPTWRRGAIARGRVVAQPAFGDALLRGEVFHGWGERLRPYLWIMFGIAWTIASGITLVTGKVTFGSTPDVPPTLCGGLLGLVCIGVGIMRLNDLHAHRQQLLDEIVLAFSPDDAA